MKLIALGFALSTALVSQAHAANIQTSCPALFSGRPSVLTNKAREARMKETEDWQISMINGSLIGHPDTPPFYFEVSANQRASYTIRSQGLHGDFSHLNVTRLGKAGVLRGTLELPVSGHTGFQNAVAWSKTDTFDIYMQVGEGPNGDQFADFSRGLIPLVTSAKSTDLITRQDVEIPMTQGKQTRILYFRSGSGGPGGYPEGRLMTFTWDGK